MHDPTRLSIDQILARLEEVEAELSAVRRQSTESDRLATVGIVAAGVAHEVNNVLAPALAYAQLAMSRVDAPDYVHRSLERTVNSIKSASDILGSMLDLAQGADGGSEGADVASAFTAATNCLVRSPEQDEISIEADLRSSPPVGMPSALLQQIFLNLLLNATRALRSVGGGSIVVTASAVDDNRVQIRFSDDGPGVPEELRGSIFRPFVSGTGPTTADSARGGNASINRNAADSANEPDPPADHGSAGSAGPTASRKVRAGLPTPALHTAQEGGRGLGLSVCYRTIQQCGGTIELCETPGGGATFVIELPGLPWRAVAQAS